MRLYEELVEGPLRELKESKGSGEGHRTELEWMKSKTPSELLVNVLTNPSRMRVYVRYLLNEIYLNDQAKVINDLHQHEMRPYNPDLKEAYGNIMCLLQKINRVGSNEDQR